mgnify:FL=1
MSDNKRLIITWLGLLALTSLSVFLAETSNASAITSNTITGIFVCFIVALKGQLVIDHLIGLRFAHRSIRRVMLSYFYILPLLITLGMVFPDAVVSMTSLGN